MAADGWSIGFVECNCWVVAWSKVLSGVRLLSRLPQLGAILSRLAAEDVVAMLHLLGAARDELQGRSGREGVKN